MREVTDSHEKENKEADEAAERTYVHKEEFANLHGWVREPCKNSIWPNDKGSGHNTQDASDAS